jgi:glycosyltransferase involved in cell wall biosynthesis
MIKKFFLLLTFVTTTMLPTVQPTVSIVTSLYNADKFIEGFMADIVRQTIFDRCELIIINANSPGNEDVVIKRYMKQYSNIVYEKLPFDPGIYAVWNMAIARSRGEFITNANVDDRLAPNCYERHLKVLQDHPEIDLVYSDFYVTYHPNEIFETACYHHVRQWPEFSPSQMWQPLPNNHPMWRKSMHIRHGMFDERYLSAGDWQMWLRAVRGGAKFLKVSGILSLYYYNPSGLSTNTKKSKRIAQEENEIRECYKDVWGG